MDGVGDVGVIVKELCDVVEVRMVSGKVIAVMLVHEDDVLRLIYGHAPQNGKI